MFLVLTGSWQHFSHCELCRLCK